MRFEDPFVICDSLDDFDDLPVVGQLLCDTGMCRSLTDARALADAGAVKVTGRPERDMSNLFHRVDLRRCPIETYKWWLPIWVGKQRKAIVVAR